MLNTYQLPTAHNKIKQREDSPINNHMKEIRLLKNILIIVLLTFSLQLIAQTNPIIKCLAQEEEKIHHSKTNGPLTFLNQKMLNELIMLSDVRIKAKYINIICNNKKFSPSLMLIKTIIEQGTSIFILSDSKNKGSNAYIKASITSLFNRLPIIFIQYIAYLNGLTAHEGCLQKEIPELGQFLYNFKYLEGEISYKKIITQKSNISTIFKKLSTFDEIMFRCQKRIKEQKEKMRKKFKIIE
jgi:hypothetical protein